MNVNEQYPALLAYIHNRNTLPNSAAWCGQLRTDETAAREGGFADVAAELKAAKAAYAEAQKALGREAIPTTPTWAGSSAWSCATTMNRGTAITWPARFKTPTNTA
jgi:hypothetical protein